MMCHLLFPTDDISETPDPMFNARNICICEIFNLCNKLFFKKS